MTRSLTDFDVRLLLSVLQYAPVDDRRQRLRRMLASHAPATTIPARRLELSPPDAALLWEDVVWLGHLLPTDVRSDLNQLKARLSALMAAEVEAPIALSPVS
jgi:hypothetical protein